MAENEKKTTHQEEKEAKLWTCPMHPEIQQGHPGQCPKCGMDLEPATTSNDDEEEGSEIRGLKHKTIAAGILTIPILLLASDSMIPGLSFDDLLPL